MGRNKTPQTFEKRRRELDKQMKRKAKIEKRHERNAQKKENKRLGIDPTTIYGDVPVPHPDDLDSSTGPITITGSTGDPGTPTGPLRDSSSNKRSADGGGPRGGAAADRPKPDEENR